MAYTWTLVDNNWQLILKKEDKNINQFYLPKILGSDFFKAIVDRNGKFKRVGNDVFEIYFENEIDVKLLIEEFLEPRTLMFKMKENVS